MIASEVKPNSCWYSWV